MTYVLISRSTYDAPQSVHVMMKHDRDAAKQRGQPVRGYVPRQPLSERLAAMEAARQRAAIKARENEEDRDILAAVTMADCGSGSAEQ